MTHEAVLSEIAQLMSELRTVSEVGALAVDPNRVSEGKAGSRAPTLPHLPVYDEALGEIERAEQRVRKLLTDARKSRGVELSNLQRDYWIGVTGGRPEDVADQFGVERQTVVDIRQRLGLAVKTGKQKGGEV